MTDKTLETLQEILVGNLRHKKPPRGRMSKKKYNERKHEWPVVLIYKVERHWQVQWPNIPEKRVRVHGFKIHYIDKKGMACEQYDRGKWILKNYPKIPKGLYRC